MSDKYQRYRQRKKEKEERLFPFEKSTAVYLRATVKQAVLGGSFFFHFTHSAYHPVLAAWSRAFVNVSPLPKGARIMSIRTREEGSSIIIFHFIFYHT
jgi:hypothetical protein